MPPEGERIACGRGGRVTDYLIVGGGTAGCIVRRDFRRIPSVTVTVLEAARPTRTSRGHETSGAGRRCWRASTTSTTEACRSSGELRHPTIQDAILGGCSTANTMITWRPLPADLDEWAALGVSGWDRRLGTPGLRPDPSPPCNRSPTKHRTPTSTTSSTPPGGRWTYPPAGPGTRSRLRRHRRRRRLIRDRVHPGQSPAVLHLRCTTCTTPSPPATTWWSNTACTPSGSSRGRHGRRVIARDGGRQPAGVPCDREVIVVLRCHRLAKTAAAVGDRARGRAAGCGRPGAGAIAWSGRET